MTCMVSNCDVSLFSKKGTKVCALSKRSLMGGFGLDEQVRS